MGGYTSNVGTIVPFDADAFNADRPCSAINAFLLRNNIEHMIDESPQVYVNWAGMRTASDCSWTYLGKVPFTFSQTFVCSWVRSDRPANLDVFVTARTRGSNVTPTLQLRIRVVPGSSPIGDLSAPYMIDATTTISSTTPVVAFDEQAFFTTPREDLFASFADVTTNDNGTDRIARVSVMRVEVTLEDITEEPNPNEGQVHEVTSLMLAGFA